MIALSLMEESNVYSIRGKTVSLVRQYDNQFSLIEWGGLDFARRYCEALMQLYCAIDYNPPHSGVKKAMSLDQGIKCAEACCKILCEMQDGRERLYPGNKCFMGCHGIPWTATISCLEKTVESWKVLIIRTESLQIGCSSKIHSHAIANESYVEHSFGFTKKKGQGNNESMEEYVISKRAHMIDFQMRMSVLPFNQHTKTKLRDKGYQSIESRQVPMSLKEFKEIFSYAAGKTEDGEKLQITDECKQILKKA